MFPHWGQWQPLLTPAACSHKICRNLQELIIFNTYYSVKFTEYKQVFQELLRLEQLTNNNHRKLDYQN